MSLAIKQRSLGMNHPDFAISLNNMAMLCNEQGQLRQAEHYYQQALEIQRRSFGENHSGYAILLDNIAQEKLLTGNADKAQSLYIRSAGLYKEMYLNSLDFMSEKQRASYWSVMQNKFAETYPVFVLRYSRTNPSVA